MHRNLAKLNDEFFSDLLYNKNVTKATEWQRTEGCMAANTGEKERFVRQMICRIADGTLPADCRLPTESELAAEYGIA